MPIGPSGKKRLADVIGNAVTVARIATGEADEEFADDGKNNVAVELDRRGGRSGAEKLTSEQRSETARKAASERWNK